MCQLPIHSIIQFECFLIFINPNTLFSFHRESFLSQMIWFFFEQGNLSAYLALQKKYSYICFENLKPGYWEIALFPFFFLNKLSLKNWTKFSVFYSINLTGNVHDWDPENLSLKRYFPSLFAVISGSMLVLNWQLPTLWNCTCAAFFSDSALYLQDILHWQIVRMDVKSESQ